MLPKRLLLALLFLFTLNPFAQAADKLKELVVHAGETVYARFEVQGRKLKLVAASKEPDAQAQVIFTLERDAQKLKTNLRVENKFPKDFIYRAELRIPARGLHGPANVTPVVAGKLALESFPVPAEEMAAFDFKLAK